MSAYPDSQLPTDEQKKKLCYLLFMALAEIRIAGTRGRSQEAADLADAFHNLPLGIWHEWFSLDIFRQHMETYCKKYPHSYDYLSAVDEIRRMRQ
jgi:hypothetical protein